MLLIIEIGRYSSQVDQWWQLGPFQSAADVPKITMAQIQVVTCKSLPHAWMQPAYGCHYVNCQDVTKILIHTLVIKADICHTRHNRLTGKNGDGITSQLHETSNYVIAAINCDGIRLPDSAWSIYKNNSPINGSLSTNVTLANGIKSGLLLLQYLVRTSRSTDRDWLTEWMNSSRPTTMGFNSSYWMVRIIIIQQTNITGSIHSPASHQAWIMQLSMAAYFKP